LLEIIVNLLGQANLIDCPARAIPNFSLLVARLLDLEWPHLRGSSAIWLLLLSDL